jgi:hypothetical protein
LITVPLSSIETRVIVPSYRSTKPMISATAACSLSATPGWSKRSRVSRMKSIVASRNSVEYCNEAAQSAKARAHARRHARDG